MLRANVFFHRLERTNDRAIADEGKRVPCASGIVHDALGRVKAY